MSTESRIYLVIIGLWLMLALAAAPADAQTGGTVVCWGANSYGQCTPPSGLSGITAVAAGLNHSLALKSDGTVVCWGGDSIDRQCVFFLFDNVNIKAIAAGRHNSIALTSEGGFVLWNGSLNLTANYFDPPRATGFSLGATFSDNCGYSCLDYRALLLSDGTVQILGDPTVPSELTSPDTAHVIAIAAGGWHRLALKSKGTVVCWGDNSKGQCSVPPDLSDVTSIAAGFWHSLALRGNGTVVCWGDNSSGQCNVPDGLTGVTAIAAGGSHNLALTVNGAVVCWGSNDAGQCDRADRYGRCHGHSRGQLS